MANKIFFILLVFTFIACKKENNQLNNNSNSSVDTTQLAMYFEKDLTLPLASDSSMKVEYFYDANNRVKEVKSYAYYFSTAGLLLEGDIHFEYIGNDTLPYLRIADPGPNYSPQYRDSMFFFYNSAGKLVLDTAREYIFINPTLIATRTIKYSYSTNSIDITQVNYYSGGTTINSKADWTYGTDLNFRTLHTSNDFNTTSDYQFTFDNHPNPFNTKGCRVYSPFNDTYGTSFSISSSSKNNLTSVINDYHDVSTHLRISEIRSFNYKANGYPEKVEYFDNTSGTAIYTKSGFYKYQH